MVCSVYGDNAGQHIELNSVFSSLNPLWMNRLHNTTALIRWILIRKQSDCGREGWTQSASMFRYEMVNGSQLVLIHFHTIKPLASACTVDWIYGFVAFELISHLHIGGSVTLPLWLSAAAVFTYKISSSVSWDDPFDRTYHIWPPLSPKIPAAAASYVLELMRLASAMVSKVAQITTFTHSNI